MVSWLSRFWVEDSAEVEVFCEIELLFEFCVFVILADCGKVGNSSRL